ncbi:MAG: tetratricopeptide repeat protein [Pseudomonadota bacterium]
MTSEDSTVREVDQELAEERQMKVIRQIGPILIGVGVAIVMAVAGIQIFNGQKEAAATKGALAYHGALLALEDAPEAGEGLLSAVTRSDAPGYAALAAFQRAPLLARDGDTAQAYRLYRDVVANEAVSDGLRDLARLRAAYLSLDTGGRKAVAEDLGDLPNALSPLGYYAREIAALAAIRDEDYDAAIEAFDFLALNPDVPAILKSRSREFAVVARAGRDGANISGKTRVEDLLQTLGTDPATGTAEEEPLDAAAGESPADIPVPGDGQTAPGAQVPPVQPGDATETPTETEEPGR